MAFHLVADWRRVLLRAWTVRLNALVVLLTMLEVAVPYLDGYLFVDLPRGVFVGLAGLVSGLAAYARIVAQESVSGTKEPPTNGHD